MTMTEVLNTRDRSSGGSSEVLKIAKREAVSSENVKMKKQAARPSVFVSPSLGLSSSTHTAATTVAG